MPKPPKHSRPLTVDAKDYNWTKMDSGLNAMLDWLKGKTKVDAVVVENVEDASNGYGEIFHSYGTLMDYIEEAFLFDDGRILLCGTTRSWMGTFATHDHIEVSYYTLEKR